MLCLNKSKNIAIVNVRSHDDINDKRVDNSISIKDSARVDQTDFDVFVKTVASRIEQLSNSNDWVIVNCRAGVNRASASILAWMIFEHNFSFSKALKILKKKKADAAKYFQFKNRYQSFKEGATLNRFSWPTLYGSGSNKLKNALTQ